MIRTSTFDQVAAAVARARALRDQLARVRAAGSATLLASMADDTGLGLELPADMVADGLLKQLRQQVARLAAQGVVFDEAEREGDLPPPPKRVRKPKVAAA